MATCVEAELKSHRDNGTWKIVPRPKGCRPIGSRWVYKMKLGKVRLVAKGFTQIPGLHYDNTFTPTLRLASLRLLLVLALHYEFNL